MQSLAHCVCELHANNIEKGCAAQVHFDVWVAVYDLDIL